MSQFSFHCKSFRKGTDFQHFIHKYDKNGQPWIVHKRGFYIALCVKYVLYGQIKYVAWFCKGGKCGCFILINKWHSWVQSALPAIQLYLQSGSDNKNTISGRFKQISEFRASTLTAKTTTYLHLFFAWSTQCLSVLCPIQWSILFNKTPLPP